MWELKVDREVNAGALDAELRKALGASYVGLSTGNGSCVVYLQGERDEATLKLAEAAIAAHDPTSLSPDQRAELRQDEARSRLGKKAFAAMSEAERDEALQVLLELHGLALPPELEG